MQDRYAGDIGDFGKFALLRELQEQGLVIGINWYKTEQSSAKQDDGKYWITEELAKCNQELASELWDVYPSPSERDKRSIEALEKKKLINGDLYFHDLVPFDGREEWHQRALKKLAGANLVFLDPDNGMVVPSAEKNKRKRIKYVLDEEVRSYLCNSKSVLIYQHRPRRKEAEYIEEMTQRFLKLKENLQRDDIRVITFPRYSVRDYFAISVNEDHREKISRAFENMLSGAWGSGPRPMCRIPKSDFGIRGV